MGGKGRTGKERRRGWERKEREENGRGWMR